jgi:hypothetical protein
MLNYDCRAQPFGAGYSAHWEGDLRNNAPTIQHPTMDYYVDGVVVRTRTYDIAVGDTLHFVEDWSRIGVNTDSHSCDARLR